MKFGPLGSFILGVVPEGIPVCFEGGERFRAKRCGKPKGGRTSSTQEKKAVQVRPGVGVKHSLLGVKTNGGLICLQCCLVEITWVIRRSRRLKCCLLGCAEDNNLASTEDGKREIMKGMFTPIKIRCEDLAPVMSELLSLKKEGSVESKPRITDRSRREGLS
jgi:hypothetical protein